MKLDALRGILLFIILLLVQALVLNHIHLFGCATPLLYVYLAFHFRRDYPRWATLLWCFAMGLAVDVFSNTPGVAAAAMTFIGLLQPYLLQLFVTRESPDDLLPTLRQLGLTKFIYFLLILVFVYCLLFFTIESFSFFDWLQWLKCVVGSTVLTAVLILVIENFRKA